MADLPDRGDPGSAGRMLRMDQVHVVRHSCFSRWKPLSSHQGRSLFLRSPTATLPFSCRCGNAVPVLCSHPAAA